jgi:hypothetical protein
MLVSAYLDKSKPRSYYPGLREIEYKIELRSRKYLHSTTLFYVLSGIAVSIDIQPNPINEGRNSSVVVLSPAAGCLVLFAG